ncbi:hypothetical protein [Dyadobacter sp. CY312]|uniref:hypothetical protein n=1 Tax=Dyadobacter sp. CY312 TaxID=2907303 RepID=UPI001F18725C|nr:hypothetical protein [Dyadobacter sp. CY312]MCE7039247.1 hypothetical protein [Dyadobacter sp. CY312]
MRCAPKRNVCEELVDTLRDILGAKPKCRLQLANPIISGNTVTLNPINGEGIIEFSKDAILWQLNPTFILPNGQHRLFAREAGNMSCIQNVLVTVNVACTPNWVDESPQVTECRSNRTFIKRKDGCGNTDWRDSGMPCNVGGCTEKWEDIEPQLKECYNGFERIRTHNSCGIFGWRTTTTPCSGGCTPNWVDVVPQETECRSNKIFTKRQDGCGNFDWRDSSISCGGSGGECTTPTFALSKIDPTCSGTEGATNPNGKLMLSLYNNGTRFQVCQDSTFSCTPNYNAATPITGTGPIELFGSISFTIGQQYKDYSVRMYNLKAECFSDMSFRFHNPCFVSTECELPLYSGMVSNPATCEGSEIQNNASVKLTGVGKTTRYGHSIGTVYSGPSYADAVQLAGSEILIINLPGQSTTLPVTIRQFNGSDNCVQDVTVNVAPSICNGECESSPTFTNKFATEATCAGNTVNNDARITIDGVVGAYKWGYSEGSTYTGPDYAGATDVVGSTISILNLPGHAENKTYSFRLFNSSECYTTDAQIVPGKTCSTACVKPTFDLEFSAGTCTGTESNNDGQLRIINRANANKFQICVDAGWTCTPNYDGSPAVTGSGPIVALDNIGFLPDQEFRDFFVRMYNGSEDCYETKNVRIPNPCFGACCTLEILSVTLIDD